MDKCILRLGAAALRFSPDKADSRNCFYGAMPLALIMYFMMASFARLGNVVVSESGESSRGAKQRFS